MASDVEPDGSATPGPGATPKGKATRSRLLDAAQAELRERGIVEISVVADAAGVAQSVIHRYFGNKAGLVEAVVARFYDEYDQRVFLADIAPEANWWDRETQRIEQEVAFLYEHPLGRTVASGLLHEAAATRVDAERTRQHAAMAARNIRKGQSSGELLADVDPTLAGAAIMGALRMTLAAALSRSNPPPQSHVVTAVTTMSRPLLQPR